MLHGLAQFAELFVIQLVHLCKLIDLLLNVIFPEDQKWCDLSLPYLYL